MAERPTMSELQSWRVAELPDDFADRVLARMDEVRTLADDASESHDPVRLGPPSSRSRTRRVGIVGIACAAGSALLVLWLLRPAPPPPAPVSTRAAVSVAEPRLPPAAGLTREAIARTLDEQLLPRARLCHDALIDTGTVGSGQLILELDVTRRGGRGVVTRAEFDRASELDEPAFRTCLLDRAWALRFEPPDGDEPVEVVVPLEFHDPWAYGGDPDD